MQTLPKRPAQSSSLWLSIGWRSMYALKSNVTPAASPSFAICASNWSRPAGLPA